MCPGKSYQLLRTQLCQSLGKCEVECAGACDSERQIMSAHVDVAVDIKVQVGKVL